MTVDWLRAARDDVGPIVRPYALTRGRTRPAAGHELPVEALVAAAPGNAPGAGDAMARRILAMCHAPIAVAEVAARLPVPLGVARILVGDLRATGLVDVHEGDGRPDVSVLERVLHGLQAL